MDSQLGRITHVAWRSVVTLGGVLLTAAVLTAVAEALPGSVGRVVELSNREPGAPAVFVSPRGNDSACQRNDALRPCASFDRAYQIARQGDVVQVAGGNYNSEQISYDSSKASWSGSCDASDFSGCVTFAPAPGASVQVGEVTTLETGGVQQDYTPGVSYTVPVASTAGFAPSGTIGIGSKPFAYTSKDATHFYGAVAPSVCGGGESGQCHFADGAQVFQGGLGVYSAPYLRFEGFAVKGGLSVSSLTHVAGAGSGHTVHDVVFQDLNLQGHGGVSGAYSPGPPFHIAFLGGTYGNTNISSQALYITGTSGTVIRGISFRDIRIGACLGNALCHVEGVYLGGNTGMVIDRNSFTNIDVYDIFHSDGSLGVNTGEKVTNNYFDCSNGYGTTIYWPAVSGDTISNVTVQGNSFRCGFQLLGATGASVTGFVIAGNIFGGSMCPLGPSGFSTYDVTFVYNVEAGSACASTSGLTANHNVGNVAVSRVWGTRRGPGLDLISSSTPAEAVVPAAYCNSVDYHGNARPVPCDAGAAEVVAAGCMAPTWSASIHKAAQPTSRVPLVDSSRRLLGPCRR